MFLVILPSPCHSVICVGIILPLLQLKKLKMERGGEFFKVIQQVHGRAALASFQRGKLVNQKQPLGWSQVPRTEQGYDDQGGRPCLFSTAWVHPPWAQSRGILTLGKSIRNKRWYYLQDGGGLGQINPPSSPVSFNTTPLCSLLPYTLIQSLTQQIPTECLLSASTKISNNRCTSRQSQHICCGLG